jgi:hypothetical protein
MNFNRKNIALLSAALIVLIGIIVGGIALFGDDDTTNVTDSSVQTQNPENLDQSSDSTAAQDLPAVKQEDSANTDESTGQTADTTNEVSPQVTSATLNGDQLTVRGFVPSIVENGGECTFVLENADGAVVSSAKTTGFTDVSSTVCPYHEFDVSGLGSGAYSVYLEYESNSYNGRSEAMEARI